MLMLRGAGPAPFGARGLVLASQGGTCEVLLEREGFCNTGRFAKLRTMRSAVLPSAALLNLSVGLANPSPALALALALALTLTLALALSSALALALTRPSASAISEAAEGWAASRACTTAAEASHLHA